MDYIDYALNQHYNKIEVTDNMEKLGFDNYEDYVNYLADEKEHYQLMQAEI